MKEDKVWMSLYISPQLKGDLEAEAEADDRSLNNYVERLLFEAMTKK